MFLDVVSFVEERKALKKEVPDSDRVSFVVAASASFSAGINESRSSRRSVLLA